MTPRDAEAYLELGKSCRGQGRLAEAEAALKKALELDPQNSCARIELGALYEDRSKFVEATAEFEAATVLEPNNSGVHCQLGRIYRRQGRVSEAEAASRKARELDPENGWVRFELGAFCQDQGKFGEAAAEFERAVALNGGNGWVYCQLGRLYHKQGRASEAEAALRKALELDPHDISARIELSALYEGQGKLAEAAEEFEGALDIDKNNVYVQHQLGRIYRRQGRSSEAEAALQRALELDPRDVRARIELGSFYEEQGELMQAAAEFERTLAVDPRHVGAHLCLGHIRLCRSQWAEAEAEYQRAADLDRRNDRAYVGLWAAYRGQGRLPEAAAALAKAVEIAPTSAFACTDLLGRLDQDRALGDVAARDGSSAGANDGGAPGGTGPAGTGTLLSSGISNDATVAQIRERVFCMLPWTHLHIFSEGSLYPCSLWSGPPLGNVRSSSMTELWNSPGLRALRSDMMNGRRVAGCWRCYKDEDLGFRSMRQQYGVDLNRHRGRELLTAPDGTLPRLPVPVLDIRFSNICNLRCRICDPTQSSAWLEDSRALGLPVQGAPILKPYDDWGKLWRQLQPLLEEGPEEILFLGGEPLIMEEHYRILDFLIAHKLTDVRLRYNTNFSTLRFQGRDVIELWSRFRNVHVVASLDGTGRRGEYLRKGLRWDAVLANREEMLRRCPHVAFTISATLCIFNALHLPDFHREWVEKGYVERNGFRLHMLRAPAIYRMQVLPAALKQRVLEAYQRHRESFLDDDGQGARYFAAAARSLEEQDCSELLPGFVAMTRRLDQLRGEDCREVFPELAGLFEASG